MKTCGDGVGEVTTGVRNSSFAASENLRQSAVQSTLDLQILIVIKLIRHPTLNCLTRSLIKQRFRTLQLLSLQPTQQVKEFVKKCIHKFFSQSYTGKLLLRQLYLIKFQSYKAILTCIRINFICLQHWQELKKTVCLQ